MQDVKNVGRTTATAVRFRTLSKKFEDKWTLSFDPEDPEVQKDLQAIVKVAPNRDDFAKWIGQFEKKTPTIGSTAQKNPEEILRTFARNTGTPALDELPETTWGEVAKGLNPLSIPTEEGFGVIPGSPFWGSFAKNAKDIGAGIPELPKVMIGLGKELVSLPQNIIADIDNDLDPSENKAFAETSPILHALAMGYKQKYGSLKGFKHTLATDAWSVILDAADFIAPVLKGIKGGSLAARTARATGKGMDMVNPGEWMGNVVSGGVRRWTEHMKKNPGALADVEISFGIAEDGTPLTMKVNLEELANEYGGVENIPMSALITEDLPKHIEEAVINLYDSKHPYHQKVMERFQKTRQAILDKQTELVGKGNYSDAEAVSKYALEEYDRVRSGNYTTLGRKQRENAEILNQPITTLDEADTVARTASEASTPKSGITPEPEQIAEWDAADDIYYRVGDASNVGEVSVELTTQTAKKTPDELAQVYGYDTAEDFKEAIEEGADGTELLLWLDENEGHLGEGVYLNGVAATGDFDSLKSYMEVGGDAAAGLDDKSQKVYVFRGKDIDTLPASDGVLVTPTETIAEFTPSEFFKEPTGTGTRTTAQIVPEVVPRKGTRERLIKGNWGGKYTGRYGVDNVDNFIFSHHADGTVNPAYPERLQPRDRSDFDSQSQMKKIGTELDSELMLDDTSSMNDGAALVKKAEDVYTPEEIKALQAEGHDITGKWVVLSGNGRMAGLDYAITEPALKGNVEQYQAKLHARAEEFGVADDIGKHDWEVLFREVTDDLDQNALSEFVREANDSSGKGFRSSEVAATEAKLIDADLLLHFETGDHNNLREALQANPQFVGKFIEKLPENKRGEFYDADSKRISDAGYERIEKAMLISVFGEGETGSVLSRRFADVSDPGLVNLRKAVYAALPELAEMKYYFKNGERQADLDITEDLANAIFKTQKMVDDKASVEFTRAQGSLFDDPDHENMLRLLHVVEAGRTDPKKLTDFLKWYADYIKKQPSPDQTSLLGDVDAPTKTQIYEAGLGKQFDEVPEIDELRTQWEQKEAEAPNTPSNEEALQFSEKLFPEMTAAIDDLVARDSGVRDHINNKQLKSIVDEIDKMFAGLQKKYETQGYLTLQNLKQFRTDFNENMDVFKRSGEIIKLGDKSPAKHIAQGLSDDFYTRLENEVKANPSKFPENFDAVVRADQLEYAEMMALEDTTVGEYLRRKGDKSFQIVDDLLNPSSIFTRENIDILKQALGETGFEHVRRGALAQLFQKTRALNRDPGELALLNALNKTGGGGRNRLNAIFGEEMTQTLYKMANFQQRVSGKRGKWNTPYINEILRSDGYGDMVVATGMASAVFAEDVGNLAKNTGLSRKLGQNSEKVGVIVGLLSWWGAKRARNQMFSEAGREAILNGRSITFRDKTVVSARQIALVADWMEKHKNKINNIWLATRTGFRPSSQAKRRKETEEKMRSATVPPYRGAMPFEFHVQ